MTKINLLLGFLAILFLASCQKDTNPVLIYDIHDEFNIEIYQELSEANEVFLKLTTLEKYPSNYRIEADAYINSGNIELNIYRIYKPQTPAPNNVFLTKKVKLGALNLGTHPLDLIIRNNISNEGLISVNPNTIELDFSTKNGISSKHYEVNRFHPNDYWGIASVDSSYHAIYVDQFINKITAESTPINQPNIGNYGYFSISPQGDIELSYTPRGYYRTFFMSAEDFTQINAYIQEYKNLGISFHATVITAKGQVYQHVENEQSPFVQQTLELCTIP
ncbi:MAG TPA: hypothetical protein ENK85_04595 [Saprospiraceae bacterium]|nr:hypothetical protein [Saprospiraceae bacterium]